MHLFGVVEPGRPGFLFERLATLLYAWLPRLVSLRVLFLVAPVESILISKALLLSKT